MHKSSVPVADEPQRKCYYLGNFLEDPDITWATSRTRKTLHGFCREKFLGKGQSMA